MIQLENTGENSLAFFVEVVYDVITELETFPETFPGRFYL